jgi:hypothetical protein
MNRQTAVHKNVIEKNKPHRRVAMNPATDRREDPISDAESADEAYQPKHLSNQTSFNVPIHNKNVQKKKKNRNIPAAAAVAASAAAFNTASSTDNAGDTRCASSA